jgi:glycosidase
VKGLPLKVKGKVTMRKKIFVVLSGFCMVAILMACSPSQAQINRLSTQIAGEIYGSLTATAVQTLTVPERTETPAVRDARLEAFPIQPVIGLPQGTDGYPWWNDSVFYEIFVRSFFDSDGDGIGDLNGLTEKLDYLNDGDPETTTDLGITGIWLMPIFPSPSYHGYDVTDYYDINPDYGTLADFEKLLDEAHQRGIRVIIDLVINHTSNEHPWFQQAKDPFSPYHDWYIWTDTNPGYLGSWGQQVWFPSNGKYYYGSFTSGMPDLNYTNPEVTAQMEDVVRFWLEDVGVDGFRMDAAKHLIEEGTIQANSDSTHEWWKAFRTYYKQVDPDALVVGEVWDDTSITARYLQGDELDLSFEFSLAEAFIRGANGGRSEDVIDQMKRSYTQIPEMQFASFLANHDQDRVFSQLGENEQKMILAASLLLTSPGVPFIYYGEEIGMQGNQIHERIRRAMQWVGDAAYAGFTTGTPWQALGSGWKLYNVHDEGENPDSILAWYRTLINIRNQHAALRVGDLTVLPTTDEAVYGSLRVSDNEAVLVLLNLSDQPVTEVWLTKGETELVEGTYQIAPILGDGDFGPIKINTQGNLFYLVDAQIPAYGVVILQLQNIDG